MTKVIHCRDVGFDCDGIIRANSEEEALQMAAEHSKNVHGLEKVSPEVVENLKSVIRDEANKPPASILARLSDGKIQASIAFKHINSWNHVF